MSNRDKPLAIVVEEDINVAGMVSYFLELQSIRCLSVTSAEDGWELVSVGTPDIVIIDDRLPDHDGWWMLEQMRSVEATAALPVVMLTGARNQPGVVARAELLACGCLSKPFSYDELNARLEQAMELVKKSDVRDP